MSKFKMQI